MEMESRKRKIDQSEAWRENTEEEKKEKIKIYFNQLHFSNNKKDVHTRLILYLVQNNLGHLGKKPHALLFSPLHVS